jgi:DNA sulfur modification protein DndD
MESILEKIRDVEDEIEEVNLDLKEINAEIDERSQSEENLKYLKEQNEEIKKSESDIKVQLKVGEKNLENLNGSKEKLQVVIDKLTKEEASLNVEDAKLNYIRDLKKNFEKILSDYSVDMREKISLEATDLFKSMISEKDKHLISKIEITDNYEIKVKGWNNSTMTSDISAGQRQIVSLSFVIALAKTASGSSNIMTVPLFMDTPFGRISGENRDNLISILPNLTTQWIPLMTDTEFTRAEELQFKKTGKIASVYRLRQISTGYTKIEKIENLDEMLARR